MAFKEETISNINQLVDRLSAFCKDVLKWNSVQNRTFRPLANGESFQIFDIKSNLPVTLDGEKKFTASSLSTKIVGDSFNSRCDMITGFNRVWFSGDSSNVFVVIEVERGNFRWFGFGITKPVGTQQKGVAWNVAQYWYDQYYSYEQSQYAVRELKMLSKIAPFFGSSAVHYVDPESNLANRIKFKNKFYSDVGEVNLFGGGYKSIPYNKIINTPNIALTNSRVIGKCPLYIIPNQEAKFSIIAEMPLWYAVSIKNLPVPSEITFGGKKYMVFSVGSQYFEAGRTENAIDTDKVSSANNNYEMMIRPRTYNAGFALLME